eukprot:TRINITY_DN1007_c0_g1_i1.p1 TRINITY_DN1007_c0_g1~~TRINITY_DN1007_c0_g1_i1.p1  ORF type:complete len:499 (+),score=97.49 TRINITY_DN1007_c0_g1_i1:47-1543(+)
MSRRQSFVAFVSALLISAVIVEIDAFDPRIKHVVVLMQENRSFDHMMGFFNRLNPEINGLRGTEANKVDVANPDSPSVTVTDDSAYVTDPDPGHYVSDVTMQEYGTYDETQVRPPAPMSGFADNYKNRVKGDPQDVMRCFSPETLPVMATLSSQFATFDRWFCSVPGPTMPNRYYFNSATSHGDAENLVFPMVVGYPQKTIYEQLDEAGLTWASYFYELPTPLAFKGTRRSIKNFRHFTKFREDVLAGNLPTFTHIDPLYGYIPGRIPNDDHPNHDVSQGQKLMKEVYEILRAAPTWNETLFIITYDEHGGFYDHVPTPMDVPNPDGRRSAEPFCDFTRLGPRVPTIMISPWIAAGTVVHGPSGPSPTSEYEHSSLSATLKKMYGFPDFLTRRAAWSGTFEHVWSRLQEARTDCPEKLPEVVTFPKKGILNKNSAISPLQQQMVLIASSLTGERETGQGWSALQGSIYIQRQVNKFFGRNMYPEGLLWDSCLESDTCE